MGRGAFASMNMCNHFLAVVIGIACGIISGFGIGGGSILMVWLTAVIGMEQTSAQSINLLYFLPTAAAALLVHIIKKRVEWSAVLPAVLFGSITAAAFSWISISLDVDLLRKSFGVFLLLVGTLEFFKKARKD